MKFYFSSINLWCNKNLVDLEFIIWEILKHSKDYDVQYFEDPEDIDSTYTIINTCGFLSTSRQEAENTIKYYDDLGKKIIIVGCYIQVANSDFISSLKNLHKIIPFIDYSSVSDILWIDKIETKFLSVKKLASGSNIWQKKLDNYLERLKSNQIWKKAFIWKWDEVRAYINSPYWYEYLKIAEWCDNNCSFCIIPKIRWKQKSRKIEEIIEEAKTMISSWIREIIIIAQDTTRYWVDLYWEPRLIELLKELDTLSWDFKYRLLYMYPDNLSLGHLNEFKNLKKFIPYFDIPFQHISKNILKLMWRYYNTENIFNFLDYIKSNFEEYFLRTAFIIWFPWETDDDYNELYNFVKKYNFDAVALFEYHDEPLASSSKLPHKVSSEIAVKRIKKLDKLLNKIYLQKQFNDSSKVFTGIVEWFDWKDILVRRQLRAPEIDSQDIVNKKQILWKTSLDIGSIVKFKV